VNLFGALTNGKSVSLAISVAAASAKPLQDGIHRDHFPRDEIMTDTEVLERALRLGAPELVGGYFDRAETILFDAMGIHSLL
jgi:hypothetical protein